MDTSVLLARVIGITMIVLYGGILLNLKYYQNIMRLFAQQPLIIMLSGFMALVLGLLILQTHSVWTIDYRGLITLLAWLMVIQGAVRVVAPQQVKHWIEKLNNKKSDTFLTVASIVMLLIGVFLAYKGFISPI